MKKVTTVAKALEPIKKLKVNLANVVAHQNAVRESVEKKLEEERARALKMEKALLTDLETSSKEAQQAADMAFKIDQFLGSE